MFWVKNFHTLPYKWLSSKPKKSWSIFSDCILSFLLCTSGHAFRHSRRNKDNPSREKMASKRNSRRNGKNANSLYFRLFRVSGFSLGKPPNTQTYSHNDFVFKTASFLWNLNPLAVGFKTDFDFHTQKSFLFGVLLLAAFRRRTPCRMNQCFLFCHCKCGPLQGLLRRGTTAANAGVCNFILNCTTLAGAVAPWVSASQITCKSICDAFMKAGSSNLHHQLLPLELFILLCRV